MRTNSIKKNQSQDYNKISTMKIYLKIFIFFKYLNSYFLNININNN